MIQQLEGTIRELHDKISNLESQQVSLERGICTRESKGGEDVTDSVGNDAQKPDGLTESNQQARSSQTSPVEEAVPFPVPLSDRIAPPIQPGFTCTCQALQQPPPPPPPPPPGTDLFLSLPPPSSLSGLSAGPPAPPPPPPNNESWANWPPLCSSSSSQPLLARYPPLLTGRTRCALGLTRFNLNQVQDYLRDEDLGSPGLGAKGPLLLQTLRLARELSPSDAPSADIDESLGVCTPAFMFLPRKPIR